MKILGTESMTLTIGWPTFFSFLAALGGLMFWGWSDISGDVSDVQTAVQKTDLKIEAISTSHGTYEKLLANIDGRLGQIDTSIMGLTVRVASVEQGLKEIERRVSIVERRMNLASEDLKGGFVIVPSKNDNTGNKMVPVNPEEMNDIIDKLKSGTTPETVPPLYKPAN